MRGFSRLLACAALGYAVPGWAATVTTTFTVTATVVPTCSVSASALSFGTAIPNPINTNVDATSTITATCSAGAPYTISLNAGTGAGATFASRRMTSGPNALAYTLYTDAGRSIIWGDGTSGSSTFNGAGTGVAQAITVFGRILSGQSVPTGAYSDTITVTITF
jgi:spore coat protein U-like protein